ncbi:MAG TPA: metallophosphoesterase family protein [Steroidobacteraceae bacterium]|nr:metallophosphoesterase family protein [Steroidobacteraceae bacterium]
MKIAAISDIHGNLGALDAVLADVGRRGVDLVVNLGDILSGPLLPCETADRLMALDLPTIGGNHERQVLAPERDAMGPSDRHAAESITGAQREWLSQLPATLWVADGVFLCHATPESDVACFLEDIRDGELIPAALRDIEDRAKPCTAPLILCGHTHIPRVAQLANGQMIVNPGSVGIQAYYGNHPVPHTVEIGSPHARYALVEESPGGWIAELIAVPYDWEAAARVAQRRARPDWARALRTGFVRGPPG